MTQEFKPPRQQGFILHLGALLLVLSAVGFASFQAFFQQERGFIILYLIAGIIAFLPFPIIAYRFFALIRSRYTVDREGISIQWGLREVVIPIAEVEWIRRASDLTFKLSMPSFSVPGAVLGLRHHRDLGPIEYIASTTSNLLLVASREKVYAISPKDFNGILTTFSRNAELGSISAIAGKSASANFLFYTLLKDKVSRLLLILGLWLSIVLLIATSFVIPMRESIPLGFSPIGQSAENSPSERLLLLPVLSLLALFADISFGAYLYRKEGFRVASYLAFGAAMIMPLSFLGILIFLLIQNPN